MSRLDLNKIKQMTNNKIGYSNYESEEFMKKKRIKLVIYCVSIFFLLILGTITVNAATNNSIIEFVTKIIKVNGTEKEGKIYITDGETAYSKCSGKYVTNTESKCVEYSPYKDSKENTSTICFPLDTEFDEIEIYYNENNFFSGFHISGTSNGEEFDYEINDNKN